MAKKKKKKPDLPVPPRQPDACVLGVDPGAKGAFAVLDPQARLVEYHVMPTLADQASAIDPAAMYGLIRDIATRYPGITAALESVSSRPGQGVVSVFTFGRGWGMIEMALISLAIPYELVRPAKWQLTSHQGLDREVYPDPKVRSLEAARRLWPHETFLATKRSKVPSDGIVDAALLAWYRLKTT